MDSRNTGALGVTEGTDSSARAHHAGDGGAVAGPPWRLSAKRKRAAVQRLMRGEGQEAVSRELNAPRSPRRPGPRGACSDAELLVHIQAVIDASPFSGEG
jgi:hypothetical protein